MVLSVEMGPPSDCCHGDPLNNVASAVERTAEAMTENESDMEKKRLGEGRSSVRKKGIPLFHHQRFMNLTKHLMQAFQHLLLTFNINTYRSLKTF